MPQLVPLVNRSRVAKKKSYQDYREELRVDFWFSCAYCSITEIEASGIGFQIDHYIPPSSNPSLKDAYENLMYSCQQCNRYKWDIVPSKNMKNRGLYFLKIDEEDPRPHIGLEDQLARGLTPTGVFNVKVLNLNRHTLIRIRSLRQELHDSSEIILNGLRTLMGVRIDTLPRGFRLKFRNILKKYKRNAKLTAETIREIIDSECRSSILDQDPNKKDDIIERRKYLKEIKALVGS